MSIRHTILGLLDWAPMHGYALRELARSYQFAYPMPTNNIYPTLKQLVDEGLIVDRGTEVIEGRARRKYEIAPAGREELKRWLTEAAPANIVVRDPNTLKIALLRDSAIADARGWLLVHRDSLLEDAADAEAFLAEHGADLPRYTRLVAEYGIHVGRDRAEFIERLIAEIEKDLQPNPG